MVSLVHASCTTGLHNRKHHKMCIIHGNTFSDLCPVSLPRAPCGGASTPSPWGGTQKGGTGEPHASPLLQDGHFSFQLFHFNYKVVGNSLSKLHALPLLFHGLLSGVSPKSSCSSVVFNGQSLNDECRHEAQRSAGCSLVHASIPEQVRRW